jgi:hypothetical protein
VVNGNKRFAWVLLDPSTFSEETVNQSYKQLMAMAETVREEQQGSASEEEKNPRSRKTRSMVEMSEAEIASNTYCTICGKGTDDDKLLLWYRFYDETININVAVTDATLAGTCTVLTHP